MTPQPERAPNEPSKADELREELRARRDDLRRLADEVRLKIHLGGMDAKDTWARIRPKLEEFERRVEEVGAEMSKEARVLGSALKAELQKLRDRL